MEKTYLVVMRGDSTAHFMQEDSWSINVVMEDGTTVPLRFYTDWADAGVGAPLPGLMMMEATTQSPDAEAAMDAVAVLPHQFVICIAFACNSQVAFPVRYVALDVSPGFDEHEFLQASQPVTTRAGIGGRRIRPDELVSLMHALEKHPSRSRLMRVLEYYRRALGHWSFDDEWLASAYLFIAAETLALVYLRQATTDAGLAQDDYSGIAELHGIQVEEGSRAKSEIAAWFRRERVFHGDTETHRAAKRASDGFEHGYLQFPEIERHGRKAAAASFSHLRRAIIGALDLTPDVASTILKRTPLDTTSLTQFVHGHFVGEPAELSAPGERFPFFEWSRKVERAWIDSDGFHAHYPCDIGPLHCSSTAKFVADATATRHLDRADIVMGASAPAEESDGPNGG